MLPCVRRLAAALLLSCAGGGRTDCGPALAAVPAHVALIMDGNRRFADQHGLSRIDGHTHGYAQMKRVIQWCLELGVSCVSVYAFSIDNFRRPADEVAALMELAAAKFEELLHDEDAKRWGAELRVIGDLSLAPPALQAAAARLMRSSREPAAAAASAAAGVSAADGGTRRGPGAGGRPVVNICFSYTSSQELHAAAGQLAAGLAECELLPHDVTPSLLQRVMHTQDCPPVDLLVRTSGEQRLSDFLCWQSAHALLHWERCRWPEFGYAQLLRALLAWQAAAPQLAALRAAASASLAQLEAGGQCEQELLLAGSCGGSGGASPPGGLLPMLTAPQQQPGGGGWQQQQQQQQDTARVLDQLQRSSEVLAQLQKQQQQLWWGGLLFSPASGAGGGSPLYPTAAAVAAAAAPAGRSPERASSTSLSVISEDEAAHAPHPWQPLRLEGWLRRLEDEREQRLAQLATAAV